MGPDFEKYRPLLDEFDLNEGQKDELIAAVWSIMGSFVDRAFGDDPVQQVTCGKAFGKAAESLGTDESNSVRSVSWYKIKDVGELKP